LDADRNEAVRIGTKVRILLQVKRIVLEIERSLELTKQIRAQNAAKRLERKRARTHVALHSNCLITKSVVPEFDTRYTNQECRWGGGTGTNNALND
jgi:hypothetical protein